MHAPLLLWGLLAVPALGAGACLLLRSPRAIIGSLGLGVLAGSVVATLAARHVFAQGPIHVGDWLFLDALSAYHIVVLALVFLLSSLYAPGYFRQELRAGTFTRRDALRYAALWYGSFASMALVMISNNLGLMWVGVEATTLLTALLIYVHRSPASLEAMWKYILICSVGVAFAFMGTLLVAASARPLNLPAQETLMWTRLRESAGGLDRATIKIAFLFLLVGYGTKAGLAPMHSWLPDAHSQAPAPVSALFSGFMLNTALYCLMRYMPLVDAAAPDGGWTRGLMVLFGLASMLVAAAFIISQRDIKRLLAYHSVEHMGIILVGLGISGFGVFAALFHSLNHAIAKTLGFFAAGRLGQLYRTHDMERMGGALRVSPVWGAGILGSLLALLGAAPFAIFMSEFQILKSAADAGAYWTLVLFLASVAIVFVGALRHAIDMAWGEPAPGATAERARATEAALVIGPLALLVILGLWLPAPLREALSGAARVVGGRP